MILASNDKGALEVVTVIRQRGIACQQQPLECSDFCFEGNGPLGRIGVGIERKRLHDMLACIEDARYTGHQRVLMKQAFDVSVLMIEGMWRPHTADGSLMEGHLDKWGRLGWTPVKYRHKPTAYAMLRRYLFSVALSGVIVCYTRDPEQTGYDVTEWFHYLQKPWKEHTGLLAMQRIAIPTLDRKPNLTRRWASALTDIGVELSDRAAQRFSRPISLAVADEEDWESIPGIGRATAQKIVKEIQG